MNDLPSSVYSICRESAAAHAVTVHLMRFGGQQRPIVAARRRAAFLMRSRLKLSFPMIAAYLNAHHVTAMAWVRNFEEKDMLEEPIRFRTVLKGPRRMEGDKLPAHPQAFHATRAQAADWAKTMLQRAAGPGDIQVVEIYETKEDLVEVIRL